MSKIIIISVITCISPQLIQYLFTLYNYSSTDHLSYIYIYIYIYVEEVILNRFYFMQTYSAEPCERYVYSLMLDVHM